MLDIMLMSFLGTDQPNQLNRLMQVLDDYHIHILDMGQSVIHNQLTLGIMAASNNAQDMASAMREMLMIGQAVGLTVRFTPISESAYTTWVTQGGQAQYMVTVLAPELTPNALARVTQVISQHGFNIDKLRRLSQRPDLSAATSSEQHIDIQAKQSKATCFELTLKGNTNHAMNLRRDCLTLSHELGIDIAVQEDNIYRRNRRLVCFDMDSTLIRQEVINELATAAGVGDKVAAITERAMQGEIDFNQSFEARVALLEGLSTEVLDSIAQSLTITEGAHELISSLKTLGYRTAILSGGFTYFAEYLQDKLGIDEVHANILDIRDGKVSGQVSYPIVDGERKALLLKQITKDQNINLEQVIAVGDGANDLPMLATAGLGIAFRAKPKVRETADHAISTLGLDSILYLLGVRDEDQAALIKTS